MPSVTSTIQLELFEAYERTIIEYILIEILTLFHRDPKPISAFMEIQKQFPNAIIDKMVDSIETLVHEDVDLYLKGEPNRAAALLSMAHDNWIDGFSFLNMLITLRVRDLLYPVYRYVSDTYLIGVLIDYETCVIINSISLEIRFKVTSETMIRENYLPLSYNYNNY